MVLYRRNLVPGGTYFFTVTLADRGSDLMVRHISLLREAFRVAWRERPFHIHAIVLLPDHLHAVWTPPPGDANYPDRWWCTDDSKHFGEPAADWPEQVTPYNVHIPLWRPRT